MPDPTCALVTGASSGIGECFARTLAARGHNLVLVARTYAKLASLAGELRARHGVLAEPIEFDLSSPGAAQRLAGTLHERRLHVDLLVNNAGFGARGKFWELGCARQVQMIELNVVALVELTHLLLPGMIAQRRGAVINVSSTSGFQPVPYTAVYAATKAFVTTFSDGLREELRGTGVKVVTLCPGFTRSNFHVASGYGPVRPPGGWQQPEEVVTAALQALDRGGGLVVPRPLNKLSVFSQRFAPRGLVVRIAGRLFRT